MYRVTTLDGLTHTLHNLDLSNSNYSENFKNSIQLAIATGSYKEIIEESFPIPLYEPKKFNLTLMNEPGFKDWQKTLESTLREDLKLLAITENWDMVEIILKNLLIDNPVELTTLNKWQKLADDNGIPLKING